MFIYSENGNVNRRPKNSSTSYLVFSPAIMDLGQACEFIISDNISVEYYRK